MPKEGKNERFARRVCELLKPHVGAGFEHVGSPLDRLKQRTPFGYEAVAVYLWGANAPHRHLEFTLGVWHEQYETARLQLDLKPTLDGALHFWQTTGNLASGWAEFTDREGMWDANLNEDPAALMPTIVPYLADAMRTVFDACGDLRNVRELLEDGVKRPLFSAGRWEKIVLIDVVLVDWHHLRAFVQRKDLEYSRTADPELLERIEDVFGVKCPNAA